MRLAATPKLCRNSKKRGAETRDRLVRYGFLSFTIVERPVGKKTVFEELSGRL